MMRAPGQPPLAPDRRQGARRAPPGAPRRAAAALCPPPAPLPAPRQPWREGRGTHRSGTLARALGSGTDVAVRGEVECQEPTRTHVLGTEGRPVIEAGKAKGTWAWSGRRKTVLQAVSQGRRKAEPGTCDSCTLLAARYLVSHGVKEWQNFLLLVATAFEPLCSLETKDAQRGRPLPVAPGSKPQPGVSHDRQRATDRCGWQRGAVESITCGRRFKKSKTAGPTLKSKPVRRRRNCASR